ncbi:hypothetical protein [Ammoniphilus sp. 3BR4]|uniref:hypothetical protein n=1 Tax=Ammoniphilus sp. 3BR4 TaxID=3158265 RepID=UPI0034665935
MQHEAFQAMLYMTLALELQKPDPSETTEPCIRTFEETTCYFNGVNLTFCSEKNETKTLTVHFAQYNAFALLVDPKTDDILYDLFLPNSLYMIIEAKRALMLLLPNSVIMLRFNNNDLYDHFIKTVPPDFYFAAVQRYNQDRKEKVEHV